MRSSCLGDATADAYRYLGISLLDRKPDDAETFLRRADSLSPYDPFVERALAEVLEKGGKTDEAVAKYAEAARAMARRGDLNQALALTERATSLKPEDPKTWSDKGTVLRLMGKYEEALAALDKALGLSPDDEWALAERGETLRMLGRD